LKPKLIVGAGTAFLITLAGVAWWLDRPVANGRNVVTPERVEASSAVIYATSFPDLVGNPQSLGQWQNKLLVLNFWATWCAPCKEEMPLLAKLQSEYGPKGLQIVGIAIDSRVSVANFSVASPVGYPLLPDEARAIDFSRRLGNRLGLLPYTVVMRAGGEVIFTRMGVVREAEMHQLIRENLPK